MTRYLTIVYRDVEPGEEVASLVDHPKMSASSWSHAMHERDDAKLEADQLRADAERYRWLRIRPFDEVRDMFAMYGTEQQRDEAIDHAIMREKEKTMTDKMKINELEKTVAELKHRIKLMEGQYANMKIWKDYLQNRPDTKNTELSE